MPRPARAFVLAVLMAMVMLSGGNRRLTVPTSLARAERSISMDTVEYWSYVVAFEMEDQFGGFNTWADGSRRINGSMGRYIAHTQVKRVSSDHCNACRSNATIITFNRHVLVFFYKNRLRIKRGPIYAM